MRAIISGPEQTPYAFGCFLYDIYLHDTFPTAPPEMKILTTGNGGIRFNPNLYSNGYVCLSLLGTWSGQNGENWDHKTSNIMGVLMSIQSLVMGDNKVLFKEPSYINLAKEKKYEGTNMAYCNVVKYGNIKYAMNEMLKHPPTDFEEIIKIHFYINKSNIINMVG